MTTMKLATYILAGCIAAVAFSGCADMNTEWWKPKPKPPAAADKGLSNEDKLNAHIKQLDVDRAIREDELKQETMKLKARVDELEFLNRQQTEHIRMQEKLIREGKVARDEADAAKARTDVLQQKIANLELILRQLQSTPAATRPAAGK
jgi:outer membrane murein-binding lipoprotein Lpp